MTKKQAVAAYRQQLTELTVASIVLLFTGAAMIWSLPTLIALDPIAADAYLAIGTTALGWTFAKPLVAHARAVHLGAQADLHIQRAGNGLRGWRILWHSALAVRGSRRRAAAA